MKFLALFVLLLASFSLARAETPGGVSLDQRIGQTLPRDLVFKDENGARIRFADLINKPTVFAPVYMTCPHTCPFMLQALSQALARVEGLVPGRDFQVVTLSFNENDTPGAAREKKINYMAAAGKPLPEDAWKFLTGDKKNIDLFLKAGGYHIQQYGHDFSHPVAIFVTTPQGQIVRYLHGINYTAFDLAMAIQEAGNGRLGAPSNRLMGFCYTYDPAKKSYVFNVLKVTGAAMVLVLFGFLAFLLLTSKGKPGSAA